MHNVKIFSLF